MYENYSVLFVDDEVNILNSLRRGLMDEEFSYHFAISAKEALKILESTKIDVIITDMRMPEMNGLELLKIITEKYPLTVKIVLSGYTQLPQILATINQVDIFKYVTKPWELEELLLIIHKALDYYILQEENINYKKIIEAKNQTYQNILKKIDDVVENAKKSSELLGICGKSIIGFGKHFSLEERMKYQSILSKQDVIFDIFSKAVTNENKEYSSNELIGLITNHIIKRFPDAKIDQKVNAQSKINVNIKMLEAALSTIMIVFNDEFKTYGFFSTIAIDNKLKFSIVSPNAYSAQAIAAKKGLFDLDVKVDFVNSILEKVLQMCQITLHISKTNDSLAIRIIVEE